MAKRPPNRPDEEAPLPIRPAFKREFLDFERGIRMAGLEPNERITQIVKAHLVAEHGRPFLIDKWGRGRYWRWICWLPRANRDAKPLSSGHSFASAKLFVSLFPGDRELKAGFQVERASVHRGHGPAEGVLLREDWDWHRFVRGLRKDSPLAAELDRLIRVEEFLARVGAFSDMTVFRGPDWGGVRAMRQAVRAMPDEEWGGVQVYYPFPQADLAGMSGPDIVGAVLAVFDEVGAAMNRVMSEPVLAERSSP